MLLVVVIAACAKGDTRRGPSAALHPDSIPWYLDTAEGCGFVTAMRSVEPMDLIREYVRRDGAGEFLSANAWMDSSLVCAGHLPGWDVSTLITGAEVSLLDSSGTAVRVLVRYAVVGFHGPDLRLVPATGKVDTFVVLPTPWGWRIDGPQLNQHILPLTAMRFFRLRGDDSLAIEMLIGSSTFASTDPPATLLIPGMDHTEAAARGPWFGLYESAPGRWTLKPVQVGKGIVRDECRESDVPIVTVDPAGARFMVSSTIGLRAGTGPTLGRTPIFVAPGDSVVLPISGTHIQVEIHGNGKEEAIPNGRLVRDYTLVVLQSDGEHGYGVLAWKGNYSEVAPSIEWIGDLNQDGFPDVLVKIPTEGYGTLLRLLFSDDSGEETEYRPVGEVPIMDC